jgi:hypothetical protein
MREITVYIKRTVKVSDDIKSGMPFQALTHPSLGDEWMNLDLRKADEVELAAFTLHTFSPVRVVGPDRKERVIYIEW